MLCEAFLIFETSMIYEIFTDKPTLYNMINALQIDRQKNKMIAKNKTVLFVPLFCFYIIVLVTMLVV